MLPFVSRRLAKLWISRFGITTVKSGGETIWQWLWEISWFSRGRKCVADQPSTPCTQSQGSPDIWQDLHITDLCPSKKEPPLHSKTSSAGFSAFILMSKQPLTVRGYLFLPGIFSILELTETISQRCLDLVVWLYLFHSVLLSGELCQP